jgi:signal peptidase I
MNQNYDTIRKTPLSVCQLERELKRERYKSRYRRTLKSTVFALITVAAVAILVATLWLPVLQIYGDSMSPTLNRGEVVVSIKGKNVRQGDIIAFYYNNKILVKRVIAGPGDWVNIDADGTVYVNDEPLQEDYLKEKSLGECDITLPYQVPETRYFVMGDHRSTSVDSRSSSIGSVSQDQIVGKLALRVWPLESLGGIG